MSLLKDNIYEATLSLDHSSQLIHPLSNIKYNCVFMLAICLLHHYFLPAKRPKRGPLCLLIDAVQIHRRVLQKDLKENQDSEGGGND